MADWRSLAKSAILRDGKIDTAEVKMLRDTIYADKKVNRSEMDFVHELKLETKTSVKVFNDFYLKAAKDHFLADGKIVTSEAKWLRKAVLINDKVDAEGKRLLRELKKGAKKTCPEFEELYEECMKKK